MIPSSDGIRDFWQGSTLASSTWDCGVLPLLKDQTPRPPHWDCQEIGGKGGGVATSQTRIQIWNLFILSAVSYPLGQPTTLTTGSKDVTRLVERQTGTPLPQVQFLGVARDVSPRVSFHWRLSYGVCRPLCAITCINICAHIKYPIVHVSVRWIMEMRKCPACTIG